uniref:Uncharacterized protein n=1 Tax=Sinocyclocheilus rhinocerous TaxID=307959 RepID=A0A673ICP0_9TELE
LVLVFLFFIFLLLLIVFSGRSQVLWSMKDHVHKIHQARIKQHVTHTSTVQIIDTTLHSHSSLNKFFVNDIYWQHSDGPVFLYIGGEGPLSKFSVLFGHHVDMAERHGALLEALEHRFYGKSINPDDILSIRAQILSSY